VQLNSGIQSGNPLPLPSAVNEVAVGITMEQLLGSWLRYFLDTRQ